MPWGLSFPVPMPSLSIVILTRNEARNIVDCVRSARFADEVVVLDSGSTDGTTELARAEGATVSTSGDWRGRRVRSRSNIQLLRPGDPACGLVARLDRAAVPPRRGPLLRRPGARA